MIEQIPCSRSAASVRCRGSVRRDQHRQSPLEPGVGLIVLGGLIRFILHYGDITIFIATPKAVDPLWLAVALVSQTATCACADAIWATVMAKAGFRRRARSARSCRRGAFRQSSHTDGWIERQYHRGPRSAASVHSLCNRGYGAFDLGAFLLHGLSPDGHRRFHPAVV